MATVGRESTLTDTALHAAPKLPAGFKWDLRKAFTGGFLLVLLPAEGYTWNFPLSRPDSPLDAAFYATPLKNPRDVEELESAAKRVLAESLGPTCIIKPKVRKL